MENNKVQLIDLEQLVAKKNKNLLKFIPRFIINWIKRIIHQDEINLTLTKYGHLKGHSFVDATLKFLGFNYTTEGTENIPQNGRFIFISNHPLGGLDGLMLMSEVGKHFPNFKFVVNDILANLEPLAPVFLPINKHGRQSVENVKLIEEAYKSDMQILYFPAGLCSRKTKGVICDLDWKKSFLDKAIKHNRDIIPVFFEGRNSNFFYNLSNLRKKLGIKANIEMFFLPDEMFKQKSKSIKIKFGKPIPVSTFDKRHNTQTWTNHLKKHVYGLQQDINRTFEEGK
jgi:putative hemolysin